MAEHLLDVQDLHVSFATEEGVVQAVSGVSFTLDRGEVLAIVGEYGASSGPNNPSSTNTAIIAAPILMLGESLMRAGSSGRRARRRRRRAC
jgi:ABC-type dipeptide/oligopeptide/nickel transport system ATPase component